MRCALPLALAAGQSRDMRIGPTRVETNRNFATKLWNAARFCEMNGCVTVPGFDPAAVNETVNQMDRGGNRAVPSREVTASLEALRFNEAAGAAYHFVWDVFCDWYLEFAKPIFQRSDNEAKKPRPAPPPPGRATRSSSCCIPSCPSSPRNCGR